MVQLFYSRAQQVVGFSEDDIATMNGLIDQTQPILESVSSKIPPSCILPSAWFPVESCGKLLSECLACAESSGRCSECIAEMKDHRTQLEEKYACFDFPTPGGPSDCVICGVACMKERCELCELERLYRRRKPEFLKVIETSVPLRLPPVIGYVLLLEKGMYYVGTTRDLNWRLSEHCSGRGAAWTQLYRPVKIVELFYNACLKTENYKTLEYAKRYGRRRVRGGSYNRIVY